MPRAFKASNGRKEYYRCAIRLPAGGRKWVWGKTKREAEDKAIAEERLLGLGLDADAKTETLATFMTRFLDFIKPNVLNAPGLPRGSSPPQAGTTHPLATPPRRRPKAL